MSRLVLDTNVLVSALVFATRAINHCAPQRQAGTLARSCRSGPSGELKRVLTYPMFRLDEPGIAAALATLEPFIESGLTLMKR